jgi:cell division protein FtsB
MIKKIKEKFSNRTMLLIALFAIALLSIFVLSKIVTAPSFNAANIKSLDDKKVTVMKLAAAAAASSTALSLIPGDAAMPIANQIAALSSYFVIVLCAILLEKMLISVIGYVAFTYIIPAACFLGTLYLYMKKDVLKNLAIKLSIFGVILFMAIPASIKVSDLIYSSYQASIEQTVETTKQNKEYIEEKKKELSKEDKNWVDKVGDYLSNFTSNIGSGISEITKKGEDTLSTFLDTIAILIITSCVIPIVVILIFAWIIKILFSFNSKGITTQDVELISSQKKYSIDI